MCLDPVSYHLIWFWKTPPGNLKYFCRTLFMECCVLQTLSTWARTDIYVYIPGFVNTSYWSSSKINIRGLLGEVVDLKILSSFFFFFVQKRHICNIWHQKAKSCLGWVIASLTFVIMTLSFLPCSLWNLLSYIAQRLWKINGCILKHIE